jgi:hypothetical protein
MSGLTYIVRGKECDLADVNSELAAPKATRTSRTSGEYHKGFRVEGYEPGRVEKAKAEAKAESGVFEYHNWVRHNHRKAVARNFETPGAAEAAKELAERLGWTDVRIVEVKRGQA